MKNQFQNHELRKHFDLLKPIVKVEKREVLIGDETEYLLIVSGERFIYPTEDQMNHDFLTLKRTRI